MAREGQHTCLQSSSLLQHLGLVGGAPPHPGSRGEHRSPLLHARGEQARRQAHIVQLVPYTRTAGQNRHHVDPENGIAAQKLEVPASLISKLEVKGRFEEISASLS